MEWADYPGEDKWEPERSLVKQGCEGAIKQFWKTSKHNPSDDFIADPDDVWRCYKCGKGYTSEKGLKIHITRTHPRRNLRGSAADRVTRVNMRKAAQDAKPHVKLGDKDLENVWVFKYLGSRFRADGSHIADIKARIAAATVTAGKMRSIWSSKSTPLRLKLRIYKVGVCSKLTYGCEAWELDEQACRLLNGANSRMLSHITGRTAHEEASTKTRTFDLLTAIRARRLKWVGHILRMDPERLVYKALRHIHDTRPAPAKRHNIATRNNEYHKHTRGDLLMDVPAKYTWKELRQLASNRDGWRQRVQAITGSSGVEIKLSGKGGKVCNNFLEKFSSKPTPKPESSAAKQARRYRERDAHEVFFRPCATGGVRVRQKMVNSRKHPKPRPLTNKQRAIAARAHWDLHHGNNMEKSSLWAAAAPGPDSDPGSVSSEQDIWAASAVIPSQSPPTTPTATSTPPTTSIISPLNTPIIHGHHRQQLTTPNSNMSLTLTLDSP